VIKTLYQIRSCLCKRLPDRTLINVWRVLIFTKTRKAIIWINANAFFLTICLSVAGILVAHFVFQVAVFQPLEEIAFKQQEYREKHRAKTFQKQMVNRHLKLANAFLYDEDTTAAIDQYQKALKLDPTNPEAQMGIFIADIYQQQQKQSYRPGTIRRQIQFIFSEAAQPNVFKYLHPKALAHVMMGNLTAWLGKMERAQTHFETAKTIAPEASSAWFGLGLIHEPKNPQKALECYQQAVKQSPWNGPYLNNLAGVYGKLKQYEQAIKTYEFILTLDEAYLLPYCEIALIFARNKNPYMAAEYLKVLIQKLNTRHYMEMKKNQSPWLFGTKVTLFTPKEKNYFASLLLKKIDVSCTATIPELNDDKKKAAIEPFIQSIVIE